MSRRRRLWTLVLFLSLGVSACGPTEEQLADADNAAATSIPAKIGTAPPLPSATFSPSPAPTSPPPPRFENDLLREENHLASYITDECEYLALRWDPEKASPGAVVAPIMYHSIRPGDEEPGEASAINADLFYQTIELAERYGFETITSQELVDFLQFNDPIPRLSMMLIIDDRRPGTAEEYFLPIMRENNWTTTLGWLVGDTDIRTGLWDWIEELNETGYFDIQSHGFNHIYLQEEMSEDEVWEEVWGSVPVFEEHFGERPVAFIWPGGNYTATGIKLARAAGFELGFTIHSRGPIQFNAVPQGAEESQHGDPFMTLPRFWSSAALLNLDQAFQSSQKALDFAIENYPAEAEWYRQHCSGELAPLEAVLGEAISGD